MKYLVQSQSQQFTTALSTPTHSIPTLKNTRSNLHKQHNSSTIHNRMTQRSPPLLLLIHLSLYTATTTKKSRMCNYCYQDISKCLRWTQTTGGKDSVMRDSRSFLIMRKQRNRPSLQLCQTRFIRPLLYSHHCTMVKSPSPLALKVKCKCHVHKKLFLASRTSSQEKSFDANHKSSSREYPHLPSLPFDVNLQYKTYRTICSRGNIQPASMAMPSPLPTRWS